MWARAQASSPDSIGTGHTYTQQALRILSQTLSVCDVKTHLHSNHSPGEGQRREGPEHSVVFDSFDVFWAQVTSGQSVSNPNHTYFSRPENCSKHRKEQPATPYPLDSTQEGSVGEGGVMLLRGVLRIAAHDERWGPRGLVRGRQNTKAIHFTLLEA